MQIVVDRILLSTENSHICKKNRTIAGIFNADSAESLGFHLKYKNLFCQPKNRSEKEHIQKLQLVIKQWKSTQDKDIQSMIAYLKATLKLHRAVNHCSEEIYPAITSNIEQMQNIQNKYINQLIQHQGNPLCFLLALRESTIKWFLVQKNKMANNNFTEREDEFDQALQKHHIQVCANYNRVKNTIDGFIKKIETEYNILSSTKTTNQKSQNDFISHLIPKPYSQQRKTQNRRNKKSTKNRRRNKKKNNSKIAKQNYQSTQIDSATEVNKQKPSSSYHTQTPNTTQLISSKPQQQISAPILSSSSSNSTQSSNTQSHFSVVTSPDGSTTAHEDETLVRIKDEKNKAVIKLFKVASPQHGFIKPRYTQWVKAWFDNPQEALEQQGYNNPTGNKYKYRRNASTIHGFTQLVDHYLPICSTQSTIASQQTRDKKDTLITIPGSIKKNNEKEVLGLFTYIIDSKNGDWYHRNFVPRTNNQLLKDYMQQGYYNVEFPELK